MTEDTNKPETQKDLRARADDQLGTTADFRSDLREFEHEQYSNDHARRRDLKFRRRQREDKER